MIVISVLCFAISVQARVGETQQVLETRLLKPGVGRKMMAAAGEKGRERDDRESPLAPWRAYLPELTEEQGYFKSVGRMSAESGWRLQVAFIGNKSFLEAYRRVGAPLSEFEVNGVLALHRGASTWRKTEGDTLASGIGCDYVLEDDSVRAKHDRGRNLLLVFSTKFDLSVLEKKRLEREKRELEQKGAAPESIAGF